MTMKSVSSTSGDQSQPDEHSLKIGVVITPDLYNLVATSYLIDHLSPVHHVFVISAPNPGFEPLTKTSDDGSASQSDDERFTHPFEDVPCVNMSQDPDPANLTVTSPGSASPRIDKSSHTVIFRHLSEECENQSLVVETLNTLQSSCGVKVLAVQSVTGPTPGEMENIFSQNPDLLINLTEVDLHPDIASYPALGVLVYQVSSEDQPSRIRLSSSSPLSPPPPPPPPVLPGQLELTAEAGVTTCLHTSRAIVDGASHVSVRLRYLATEQPSDTTTTGSSSSRVSGGDKDHGNVLPPVFPAQLGIVVRQDLLDVPSDTTVTALRLSVGYTVARQLVAHLTELAVVYQQLVPSHVSAHVTSPVTDTDTTTSREGNPLLRIFRRRKSSTPQPPSQQHRPSPTHSETSGMSSRCTNAVPPHELKHRFILPGSTSVPASLPAPAPAASDTQDNSMPATSSGKAVHFALTLSPQDIRTLQRRGKWLSLRDYLGLPKWVRDLPPSRLADTLCLPIHRKFRS